MKIIVAQTAGFCMGVKRAVDLALDVSHAPQTKPIYSLGPLIHNGQTIEMLKQRGVLPLSQTDQISDDATIIIRAHGVAPSIESEYRNKGHFIIDGTCPKVKTVHRVIDKYRNLGYQIIITGDEGHAEVVGLLGYAKDFGHLVQNVNDIYLLAQYDKVCLVSQTTFDTYLFGDIEKAVRTHFSTSDIIVKKTICSATDKRQNETTELATKVDALIVVGGKQSANTKRLASIAMALGKPTQLVETETDVDFESIAHCQTIGVTAGASTPSWMIKRVVEYLQFLSQRKKMSLQNLVWHGLDVLTNLNVFAALAAVAMFYFSCIVQKIILPSNLFVGGGSVFFLYFFSIYLWNSISTLEATQHLGISRYRFYHKYQKQLFVLTAVSLLAMLAISYSLSQALFFLMAFATLIGTVYHITIVPKPLQRFFRYKNLKDIPTSRDLFVALAWSTLALGVPFTLVNNFSLSLASLLVFCEVFVLAYLRSVIFDLRDIEGDRIMGRETLVTYIGEPKIRSAITGIIGVALLGLCITSGIIAVAQNLLWQEKSAVFFFQIPIFVYLFFFVQLTKKNKLSRASIFTIFADFQFVLAALCAFFVQFI